MTKREYRKLAYKIAWHAMQSYMENDCYCPATKTGCWTDLPQDEYERFRGEIERLTQEFFNKSGS